MSTSTLVFAFLSHQYEFLTRDFIIKIKSLYVARLDNERPNDRIRFVVQGFPTQVSVPVEHHLLAALCSSPLCFSLSLSIFFGLTILLVLRPYLVYILAVLVFYSFRVSVSVCFYVGHDRRYALDKWKVSFFFSFFLRSRIWRSL